MRLRWILPLCAGLLWAQRSPVDEAWALVAKGQRREAVTLLHKVIQDHPRDADARLLLGSVLQEDGDRDESIAQLTEAVRLRPQSAEAQDALGEALRAFGESKSARAPFEKAVALDPKFAQARVNLGLTLLEGGEMQAAAPELDRAIELFGRKTEAAYPHYLRAKIYSDKGDVDKALAHLQQAVALRPDFAEAWSDLGEARKALLDDDGALAALEKAVSLNAEDAVAQTRLGEEYFSLGKAHLAVTHLQQAVRLDPDNQSTLYNLQAALREDGQEAPADAVKQKLAELLRRKARDDQNSLAAIQLNNQGADLEKSGDLHGALEKYRAAVGLFPQHAGLRVNYAVALLRLGQWTQGLAELRDAVRRDPDNASFKAALSDALKQAPVEFGGKGQAGEAQKSGKHY